MKIKIPKKEYNDLGLELAKRFNGDIRYLKFFEACMEYNWDTQKAYHKVIEFLGKPKVTDGTATVQGWHYLQRIKQKHLELYLEAKGLGVNKYMDKLNEGLEATKMEPIGEGAYEERPDHKARRGYHRALGEMHGVEGKNIEKPLTIATQVNVHLNKKKEEYDL